MPIKFFRVHALISAILPCIIAAIAGCAQTASHGTIDGKYLVALSGLPQLEVKTPNETIMDNFYYIISFRCIRSKYMNLYWPTDFITST